MSISSRLPWVLGILAPLRPALSVGRAWEGWFLNQCQKGSQLCLCVTLVVVLFWACFSLSCLPPSCSFEKWFIVWIFWGTETGKPRIFDLEVLSIHQTTTFLQWSLDAGGNMWLVYLGQLLVWSWAKDLRFGSFRLWQWMRLSRENVRSAKGWKQNPEKLERK